MNRSQYILFVATLILHLTLANLLYEGLYRLPAVCFLAFNYVLMILIRDWMIGFRLFFIEKRMDAEQKNPPQIFLFGTYFLEKDVYQKHEKQIRNIINNRMGLLKYIGFSLWSSFILYVIVPRLDLPLSFGLIMSLSASWCLLGLYQVAHFILVIAISFLIAFIAFLKGDGGSPWLFVPYLLALFANLSILRTLALHNLKDTSEKLSLKKIKPHLGYAGNTVMVFVMLTFFVYHFLLQFKGQSQPVFEKISQKIKKEATEFAQEKVQQYMERKRERDQEAPSQAADGGDAKQGGAPDSSLAKKMEEEFAKAEKRQKDQEKEEFNKKIQELFKEQKKMKIDRLVKKIEEEKEVFQSLDQEFRKNQSKFKNIERHQAMRRIGEAQKKLKELKMDKISPQAIQEMKKFLDAKDIELDEEQIAQALRGIESNGDGEFHPPDGGYEEIPEFPSSGDLAKDSKKAKHSEEVLQEIEEVAQNQEGLGAGEEKINGDPAPDGAMDSRQAASASSADPTSVQGNISQKDKALDEAKTLEKQDAQPEAEKPGFLEEKKFEDIKLKIDQILEHLMGLLKVLFLLALMFSGYRLFQILQRREMSKDLETTFGLSEDKKRMVQRKLAVLRQRSFDPSVEALQTYRFFLETMAMAEYPKEDWCPPTEFRFQLNKEFVGLDQSVGPMTEYFCKSYYGKKTLSDQELAHLRNAREQFFKRMVA